MQWPLACQCETTATQAISDAESAKELFYGFHQPAIRGTQIGGAPHHKPQETPFASKELPGSDKPLFRKKSQVERDGMKCRFGGGGAIVILIRSENRSSFAATALPICEWARKLHPRARREIEREGITASVGDDYRVRRSRICLIQYFAKGCNPQSSIAGRGKLFQDGQGAIESIHKLSGLPYL